MYYVIEEASEAMIMATENKQEAIDYAKSLFGKHLVKNDLDFIVYDSKPNVTYKF